MSLVGSINESILADCRCVGKYIIALRLTETAMRSPDEIAGNIFVLSIGAENRAGITRADWPSRTRAVSKLSGNMADVRRGGVENVLIRPGTGKIGSFRRTITSCGLVLPSLGRTY